MDTIDYASLIDDEDPEEVRAKILQQREAERLREIARNYETLLQLAENEAANEVGK